MSKSGDLKISFDVIQHLITGIYDAALDETRWNNVLHQLAIAFNAEQGNLRLLDSTSRDVISSYNLNKDPSWSQAYRDYYVNIDPWVDMLFETKGDIIDCTHHRIPDREYEALEIYQDFSKPQNIHYGIGGLLNINTELICYMAFQRSKQREGFTDYQKEFLMHLVPHIQRALLINEKTRLLELRQNSLCNTLSQINSAILLVGPDGRVLFMNATAEQVVRTHPGIYLKNKRITLALSEDEKRLKRLISEATTGGNHAGAKHGGGMSYLYPESDTPLSLLVSPINPDVGNIDIQGKNIAILLLGSDNQQTPLSTELLSALYDLTPSEARLAAQLCQGLTLDEVSKNLRVSKNTLKTQLRSIFNKTGTSRQIDMINLINSGPAGVII